MPSNLRNRITIVMPSAWPTGGAEEALVQLLKSKNSTLFDWQIIFLESGPLVEQVKTYGAQSSIVRCGRTREIWKWWRASYAISKLARIFKATLILGWMTKGHVYGGLAASLAGIPAAWFQMGLPENGFLDRISRYLPARAVFTCSEFVAEQQRAKTNAEVIAIPLGVDLSRFDLNLLPSPRDARVELSLPLDRPIVGIVGRLQKWKGFDTVVDATAKLLESQPKLLCVIVGGEYSGEPHYAAMLRERVAALDSPQSFCLAGQQQNVPLWMQAMDVVVHASSQEPFGIVVVEAMALGKAVVAAMPGGPQSIIHDGIDGYLTQHGDVAALADRLEMLLCNAELREKLGEEATRHATKEFSADAYAKRLTNALEIVCN